MTLQRQIGFWLMSLVMLVLLLVLLRDVLLPFIAALALAYLLDPLADRLERMGMSRLAATLVILVVFLLFFVLALVLLVPLLGQQLAGLVQKLPTDAARLQSLILERGGPWLERLGGAELAKDAQSSLGNIVGEATKWVGSVLQGLWTGGTAIIGLFSLLVLTPVIAFYLLVDWDRMVATVDGWLPLDHRETIRGLLYEMDRSIAGFLRGQALVCLLLGLFYAVGLSLLGVNFGALIGIISRLSLLHPLCRLADRACAVGRRRHRAVLAGLDHAAGDARRLRRRAVSRGQYLPAEIRRRLHRRPSGLADVCAARLRHPVWLRRPAAGGAAGGCHRRALPLCAPAISRQQHLPWRQRG